MASQKIDDRDIFHTGVFTVLASKLRILDDTDPSKVVKIDASGVSSGEESVLVAPDSDGTFVTLTGTQTLTNKTLTNPTINRTSQEYYFNFHAKVGGTAGWVVNAANDLGLLATCPASQTDSTLVIPIGGLKIGWTVTSFSLIGQIESAGNTVTIDADLRKLTAADADVTDASVQTMTQISVTADDTIDSGLSSTSLSTPEVIGAGETLYLLITATTGASTDIALQGVSVTVTET